MLTFRVVYGSSVILPPEMTRSELGYMAQMAIFIF